MIIANPIYDTVFKNLMLNKRMAKFFIETLIGEQIEDIAMLPQEYPVPYKTKREKKTEDDVDIVKEEYVSKSILRYDFIATIRTAQGERKKALIEIQKSQKPTNIERFRDYIGKQYLSEDPSGKKLKKEEKDLPIICIFLLGYTLRNFKTAMVKVNRICWDVINNKEIKQKSKFIEALTHDGYFVQIPRIKGKPRNILENLLSLFEQEYFTYKKLIKEYPYPIDNDNIREMVDMLRHAASDPKEKKALEEEWLAAKDEEGYEEALQEIAEMGKIIADKDKIIADSAKIIADLQRKLQQTEQKPA